MYMHGRSKMHKKERVQAALKLQPVDRPPYGFWTHMPGVDLDAVALSEATLTFARRYDLDFIKSMPNNLFAVEDWGCVCDYSEISSGGTGKVTKYGVTEAEDWRRLASLDLSAGAMGRELEHLRTLTAGAGRTGRCWRPSSRRLPSRGRCQDPFSNAL
jgi:uroporphyrinogen decarboxylase